MKIPDKLRVTLKEQHERTYYDIDNKFILGFATAYDPHTKAYQKREETQNNWAYGSNFIRDNKIWTRESSYVANSNGNGSSYTKVFDEKIVEERLQPIIIDNIAMDGFLIQRSISRSSTSNKLWRILDPRGFELEITTGTMEDIIQGGIIDKGLIIGQCIWRTGKILERV